jgi:hypothetical protein
MTYASLLKTSKTSAGTIFFSTFSISDSITICFLENGFLLTIELSDNIQYSKQRPLTNKTAHNAISTPQKPVQIKNDIRLFPLLPNTQNRSKIK